MLFFIRFLFYFMPLWETVWLLKLQWVSPQPHKINHNESRPFHVNLFFSPQPAMFTATHLVISMFSVFFVLCWMLEAKHIGCVGFIKCSRACKPSWAVTLRSDKTCIKLHLFAVCFYMWSWKMNCAAGVFLSLFLCPWIGEKAQDRHGWQPSSLEKESCLWQCVLSPADKHTCAHTAHTSHP